jgi:hypothetical protein
MHTISMAVYDCYLGWRVCLNLFNIILKEYHTKSFYDLLDQNWPMV